MNARKTAESDLTELDDEGLHAILEAADEDIRAAGARKQAVKAERDRRAVAAIADTLSDAQKAQLVGLIGIESSEATGTPG